MDDRSVFFEVEALRADKARPVLTPTSLEVHVRSVGHLARTTRSNYLPDRELDTLAAGTVTTMAAIELCLAGWWRRLDGGYLIVDQQLVDAMAHGTRWRRLKSACRRAWRILNRDNFIPL